ncbi:hypothetical protein [Luteibaculum oceani]|uniref:DUF3592 domain-containing protein n=1 Tax=Luteibaculum oceani TaxID=1294296 RepID=A0A5C6USD6_9FLAO|nr:hypothetical protein [Luteibaculum oceani]TXC75580.1 hypothetical protein FRX97_11955 [Luteibaculum oceani]
MRVNFRVYLAGLVILILLPFSLEWKLFVFGSKTVGVVNAYNGEKDKRLFRVNATPEVSVVFEFQGKSYQAFVSESSSLKEGEKASVLFFEGNPSDNLVLSGSGLYKEWNLVWMITCMFIWTIFCINYRKKKLLGT